MTFYIVLIVLFVAVFIFLGWRILTARKPVVDKPSMHVCPRCNERDCDCFEVDPDK